LIVKKKTHEQYTIIDDLTSNLTVIGPN